MALNLELNRVLRRLEAGGKPSLRNLTDLNHIKALRAVMLGNQPTSRTGDPELDKRIRNILNRR